MCPLLFQQGKCTVEGTSTERHADLISGAAENTTLLGTPGRCADIRAVIKSANRVAAAQSIKSGPCRAIVNVYMVMREVRGE